MSRALPPRTSFDRAATSYDATRAWPSAAMGVALDALATVLPEKGWTIEPGVGTGRFATPLQQRGIRMVGLDLSAPMLAQARLKGTSDLVRGEAVRLPFRGGAFLAGLIVHLLHLVPDWREVLSELGRVVRGPVYTVAFRSGLRAPREAYEQFLQERGEDRPTPGLHERDLHRAVPPRERRPLLELWEERPTAEVLSELEARTFASQWEVAEPAHLAAIAHLRSTFTEPVLRGASLLELFRWDAEDFRHAPS